MQPRTTAQLLTTRRLIATSVLAVAAVATSLASAMPASAINPGGGRHHHVDGPHSSSRHSAKGSDSSLNQELYKLRMCESSDNYRDNTGNGYYGAYQFAMTTWENLGMRGRPDLASPSTQDYAAKKLHAEQGWSPWPSCSQREHLR